jgi:phage-related minor tail protein
VANTVTIKVDADTKQAEANVKGMGAKFQSAMKGVAIAAGGLTLAAGAAAKLGEEFQKATNIIARGTGATGEALEGLTESFRDVFKEVPQDAETVAGALADLNTEMGLEGEALETMTKAFLNFSRAMGEDVGTAITTVSDAMAIFNIPVEQTQSLLDKLTVASQASGVSVIGLAANLETFGPILKNAGFTIEESTAIFANLEAAGIAVTRVMPALNMAIRKLAAGGVTDIKTALLEQIKAIQEATSTTEALNIATALFGADGAQRFVVAIRNGALELEPLLLAMENSRDTVERLAAETLTMSDKFSILKNRVKDTLVPFGKFATAIGPMVIMIPTLVTGITALAGAQWLATAATWAQTAASTALTLALSPIIAPLLLVAAAIAAVIVVGLLIVANWDTIREKAGIVWQAIGQGINASVNFIIDILNTLIESTNEAISLWLTPLQGVLKVFGKFIPKANDLAKALETVIPEISNVNIEFGKVADVVPDAQDAINEANDAFIATGQVLNDTVTPALADTTAAIVEGVNPAMVATSDVINDQVVPSLEELRDALADEIGKSTEATTKAEELKLALFILETQQIGVTDAYIEGTLKGADVIEMYENMSLTIDDNLVPSLQELTAALADEIAMSIEATTKAAELEHALFILESQQDGVRDAYIEGLLTGADVIKMYKDISTELSTDLIPKLGKLESSYRSVHAASKDEYVVPTASIRSTATMALDQELSNYTKWKPSIRSQSGSSERHDQGMSDWTYDSEPRDRGLKKLQDALDKAVQDKLDKAAKETQDALDKTAKEAQDALDKTAKEALDKAAAIGVGGGYMGGGDMGGGDMGGGGKMGGGGACLTINIMGPTYGLDDFEDRVTEAIRDGVRRGGFEDILNNDGGGCR